MYIYIYTHDMHTCSVRDADRGDEAVTSCDARRCEVA